MTAPPTKYRYSAVAYELPDHEPKKNHMAHRRLPFHSTHKARTLLETWSLETSSLIMQRNHTRWNQPRRLKVPSGDSAAREQWCVKLLNERFDFRDVPSLSRSRQTRKISILCRITVSLEKKSSLQHQETFPGPSHDLNENKSLHTRRFWSLLLKMLLDLFASSHPLVGIAATMIAVAGMLFVLWRLWRFTLMPHWRPHEPKELPYWIPSELAEWIVPPRFKGCNW